MGSAVWEQREEVELVLMAQEGDLEAFDALVARYRPAALLIAKQIARTAETAEDAVQDSFLAAFKALPQLGEIERFAAWFGAILRHRTRRLAAGEKVARVALDDVILVHSPSISAATEQKVTSEAVRCELSKLSEDLRPAMELYYLEEWSVRRISDFLDLPITTVKWRLHSGRKLLRASLADQLEETDVSRE